MNFKRRRGTRSTQRAASGRAPARRPPRQRRKVPRRREALKQALYIQVPIQARNHLLFSQYTVSSRSWPAAPAPGEAAEGSGVPALRRGSEPHRASAGPNTAGAAPSPHPAVLPSPGTRPVPGTRQDANHPLPWSKLRPLLPRRGRSSTSAPWHLFLLHSVSPISGKRPGLKGKLPRCV